MASRKVSDARFKDLTKEFDFDRFKISVKSNFSDFPDPRNEKRIEYPVWFLFLIILSGVLAGCNTIADITLFAEMREEWFAQMSDGPTRCPSYDTIWWFLVRVKPEAFKNLIIRWLRSLPQDLKDQLFAVDGKRLRGVSDNEHISHIVELYATESRLVIAQERVPEKSSEKSALPKLLDSVDVTGAIVSMDALYAHREDLNEVLSRGADYIVGLKGNQANLEAEVINYFEQARDAQYDGVPVSQTVTMDRGHGRMETRTTTVSNDLDWLPQRDDWHIRSVIEICSERVLRDSVSRENRYYFSSRDGTSEDFSRWIRNHWAIENSLHWVMDVVFKEDESLADVGFTSENLSLIRRLAINIIKTVDPDRGPSVARKAAAYDLNYLRGLLGRIFVN